MATTGKTVDQPRILLVPNLTELEWLIRPRLEEWAEVASFDVPGVGDEPPAQELNRDAAVQRALTELEGRGWTSCFIAADSHGIPTAVKAAAEWDGEVLAMALGHARLSDSTLGDRAPVNRAVWEAMGQLLRNDYGAFVRAGLSQLTQGSLVDELTKQLLERIPRDIALAAYEHMMADTESIEPVLRELNVPLLFAKHEGCIAATEEGWKDAVAAFPQAMTTSVALDPAVSEEFADAMRSFCLRVAAGVQAPEPHGG